MKTSSKLDPRSQSWLAPRPSDRAGDRKRVLIADDDAVVRSALAAVLKSEGYDVDEAADGSQAVAHATARPPDLVLLDLNMPNVDGWTAFTKLDHVCPLVPVIVITARPHQFKEAVRLGVDAFMEKPLDFPVLLRAIRRFTHEPEKRHTERITDRAFVTRLLNGNGGNPS
jgi:CheY-like chemotaxis protein